MDLLRMPWPSPNIRIFQTASPTYTTVMRYRFLPSHETRAYQNRHPMPDCNRDNSTFHSGICFFTNLLSIYEYLDRNCPGGVLHIPCQPQTAIESDSVVHLYRATPPNYRTLCAAIINVRIRIKIIGVCRSTLYTEKNQQQHGRSRDIKLLGRL